MINFLRTLIYNKKEFIIISLIQFLFGISELLFSLIAGYSISTFLVNEKITLYNYELNNTTIFSLLIFSILLRSYLSYLASKVSSTSIYKLWDLIIQKAFFVIRNGHININQISSFVSLIQLNSYVGLNNFFYTLYQIIGDLLLIVFGVLLLAYANITATIYTFILITIFYFTFIKNVINFSKVTGKNQKFFLDKTVSLFRNLIAFRDLNWVRNKEFDAYDLIKENSESLKKYSKRHLILDNVTRVIIESFGIVVLISYPLFSLVTSKGSISSEEFIITITLWAKLFITFYRASSRYNTITFNYTYAKSVVKFIAEYETIENYQNKGYSRLDSFNEKVTLNNKKEILHVKAFKTENKKGPNFEFPEISILRGEKYTLIGQSGSGKSSLIKTILQLPSFNYSVGNIDFDSG